MSKIGILTPTNNPELFEFSRLNQELHARGVEVQHLQPARFAALMGSTSTLFYENKPFERPSLVLARLGAGTGSYAGLIIKQMESMGTAVINTLAAIQAAKDKAQTMMMAAADKLPIPETIVHVVGESVLKLSELQKIGYPLIVKKIVGSRGNGVILVNDAGQLSALIGMLKSAEPGVFLIQKYMADQPGSDVRVIVIGGKAIASMKRSAAQDGGEIRANISRGGEGENHELSEDGIRLSERVACLLGLEIAGIDLLFSGDGYVLCEANSSPGFKGFETYCNVDIAGRIADYAVSRLKLLAA